MWKHVTHVNRLHDQKFLPQIDTKDEVARLKVTGDPRILKLKKKNYLIFL